ncbi:MAG: thioredoxin domain-containing protein [Gammaproteobacteria bacterium]|nr:thioredoxin domain-containing protein [Gammaproteobacteria bacterium]
MQIPVKYLPGFILISLLSVLSLPVTAANSLEHHPSPYLAMHADDPVGWQMWNPLVFKKAQAENKLIFVSVGYFSCHWCHVMQRESYQNDGVAEILNQHFVAVKIDRELRPELDRRLIEFVSQVSGSAGWPLNVFLTPEGYPLTGFTYLPTDVFSETLSGLQQQWINRGDEISAAAREYHEALLAKEARSALVESSGMGIERMANAYIRQSMQIADELQGGFGDASKFPQNPELLSLLQLIRQGKRHEPGVSEFVQLSLNMMASRNLMDHVNGGFFRYTTDPDWQTPHYEKMLYDNAQMVLLYFEAEKQWPGEGYAQVAELTLAFLQKSMRHANGGYVSSLSAVDVDNQEGGAYLWHSQALGKKNFEYLNDSWQLSETESFLVPPLIGIAARGDRQRNQLIRQALQSVNRPLMPVDDKQLASWNALMLQALVAAANYDAKYLTQAKQQFAFMSKAFFNQRQLIRFVGNSELAETTFEDYAFVAQAFNQYARLTGDKQADALAVKLVQKAFDYFFVDQRWMSSRSKLMPSGSGRWLIQDSVMSSALTQWLDAALTLPHMDTEIRSTAAALIKRQTRDMLDTPFYYGSLIALRHRLKK